MQGHDHHTQDACDTVEVWIVNTHFRPCPPDSGCGQMTCFGLRNAGTVMETVPRQGWKRQSICLLNPLHSLLPPTMKTTSSAPLAGALDEKCGAEWDLSHSLQQNSDGPSWNQPNSSPPTGLGTRNKCLLEATEFGAVCYPA